MDPATPRKRRRSEENAIAFYYARSNPTTPLSASSQQHQQQQSSLLRDVLSPSTSSSSSISSTSSSLSSSPANTNIDFILPPLAKRPHSLHRTWTAPTSPFMNASSPPSAPLSASTTTTSPNSSPATRARLAIPFSNIAFTQPQPQHKAAYSIHPPNAGIPKDGQSMIAHTAAQEDEHEHAITEDDMDMNMDLPQESSRPAPPPAPSISRSPLSAQSPFPTTSPHARASASATNNASSCARSPSISTSTSSDSSGGHAAGSSNSGSGSATPTLSTPWQRRFADDKSPDALSTSTTFPFGRRVTLGHPASAFQVAAAASGSSTATSPPHYHTYHRFHSPPVFGVPAFASRVSSPPSTSSARAFTTLSPAYSSASSSSSSLSSLSPPSTFSIPQRRTSTSSLGHASAFGTAFSRSLSAQDLTSATTAGLLLPPPMTSSLASRFPQDRNQQGLAVSGGSPGLGLAASPSLLVSPTGSSSGSAGAIPPDAALASAGATAGTAGASAANVTYAPLRPSPLIQSHTLTAVNDSPPARSGSNSSSNESVFVNQQQQRLHSHLANVADADFHAHVGSNSRRIFDDSSTAPTFRLGRPPKSRGGTSSGHRSSIGTTAGEDSDTASLASDMGTDDALGPEDLAVNLPLHQPSSRPSSVHNLSSTEMPDITVLALGSAMDSDPDRS
ncbi:hypothetical protein OC845_001507 [Tilletia horrida]|nr:hypothetical protein OC845_001507 [Tilletia horrida]